MEPILEPILGYCRTVVICYSALVSARWIICERKTPDRGRLSYSIARRDRSLLDNGVTLPSQSKFGTRRHCLGGSSDFIFYPKIALPAQVEVEAL